MIESLLVLFIFIGIAALFPLAYGAVYRTEEKLDPERKAEWELFVLQLRKELYLSRTLSIAEDELTIVHDSDTITLQIFNEGIRRRVNGKGHEMILQEVSFFQFYPCSSSLCVEAAFKNGEKEQAKFHIFNGGT
ncbi:competence type IV pilus minor pilin ComGF [Bacillus sp. B190/17]|uniref:Competence type IV pilus minor pilin ComGF n=1 Tax=Bacillus lumedeiriae TaxID=3058829 RepID=A0ABW8I4J7_9BACI